MGNLNAEQEQMLIEIHSCLIGTLEKQGFIGDTKNRLDLLEKKIAVYQRVAVGTIIPMVALIGQKLIEIIIK